MVLCVFKTSVVSIQERKFKTKAVEFYSISDLNELIAGALKKVMIEVEECSLKQSGWSITNIHSLQIKYN